MPFEFSGKHVVVTGASRGIGKGCAIGFARAGATVHLLGRGRSDLANVIEALRSDGHTAHDYVCDVTRTGDLRKTFEQIPTCDVLVNNAGGNQPEPFVDVEEATLDYFMTLNIKSVFMASQLAARKMQRNGGGVIVNMSSQMGHVGAKNRTVYCMTKHAVEGLTKALGVELARHNIRVNAVCPTFVETPLTATFLQDPAFNQEVVAQIPLGRVGRIDDIVPAVLFLASKDAALMTGSSMLVDGGWTAK